MRVSVSRLNAVGAVLFSACAALNPAAKSSVAQSPREVGRAAISQMAGCYVVDYNYHETKSLKPVYERDARVYDPNENKTALEYIRALDEGDNRIRLQHVLFLLDANGNPLADSMIRHQAEDWEFEPQFVWNYQGHSRWTRADVSQTRGQWVRRITNLDDGLRYQCLAPWRSAGLRSEWECGENFAPIPGRETRDMKRSDYQALMRHSRLVVFDASWLERQKNVKTIVDAESTTPLAEEVGRNWYVRVDDAKCAQAAQWTTEHLPFWTLLQQTWAQYFQSNTSWSETPPRKGAPRWSKIAEVEERWSKKNVTAAERAAAEAEIRAIIEADRIEARSGERAAESSATPSSR
jgi:hypothetical protein